MIHPDGRAGVQRPSGDEHVVDIDSLAAIRSIVSAVGERGGLSEDGVTDLVLSVNELATNVVRHGGGVGRMWVWVTDECVYCQVQDHGRGMRMPTDDTPAAQAVTGRGLWMIKRMSDRLEIVTGPTGTTVTIGFDRK